MLETVLYVLQIVVIVLSMTFSLIALFKKKKQTTNNEEIEKIDKLINEQLKNCITQIQNLSKIQNLEINNKTLQNTIKNYIKKEL